MRTVATSAAATKIADFSRPNNDLGAIFVPSPFLVLIEREKARQRWFH
jgi:hypothetical protein